MDLLRLAIACLAWPLALGSLLAGVLAQGGRWSARLDVLTHFAPIWLAAGLLALGLALAGPRAGRPALMAVCVLAALAAGLLVAPELLSRGRDPRAAADAPGRLKIVQFNAWGQNAGAEAAAAWILAQDADLVVLQEPGRVKPRLVAGGYIAQCEDCGAVILSRRPALRRYAEPPSGDLPGFIAWATFDDPAGEYTVVAAHRYWPVRLGRSKDQTARLDGVISALPRARMIVAGDFNSTPWSFARRREDRTWGLVRRTRALFTWPAARRSHNRLPAPFPWLPIDHVYAGEGWATVSVERGPDLGSDHYPVVVTLARRLPPAR
ncbi:endonuclease/exonuclease/phosphatase family protein [Phenylobacterium sp.]|uniref:endonuclease/exonuclease/phosphatase family protein n=1 Tax=Phenylobacterium sp. TaxID=1871053 RepID=UPI0025E9A597|nr:endonuclease/exonuclease/phosphatase family protein [Phenylobacterium sp.]